MNKETIGERIKRLRKEKNISVTDFADMVGTSRMQIYRYESGQIEKMPYKTLINISKALNVASNELLNLDDGKMIKEGSDNKDNIAGERIRTARKFRKMSMKELGIRMGMSEGNISRYENGQLSCDVSQAQKFANILGVSASYICGWDNYSNIDKDLKKWINAVGELNFSDAEFEELTNYAKYIVSKRK